jgi:hypothetical protein
MSASLRFPDSAFYSGEPWSAWEYDWRIPHLSLKKRTFISPSGEFVTFIRNHAQWDVTGGSVHDRGLVEKQQIQKIAHAWE